MNKIFTVYGKHNTEGEYVDRVYNFLLEHVLVVERKDDHWINGSCNYDIAIILDNDKAINIMVSEGEYNRILACWNKFLRSRKYYYKKYSVK